jgi:hypothetical protein
LNAENLSGYSNNATQKPNSRALVQWIVYTKKRIATKTVQFECVIYSNNNQYPASWYGFAGCFNLR